MNSSSRLASIWKVALTGGIGSGKSAAANEFEKLGVPIIDSDAIAHSITAPNGAAIPEIVNTFGKEYLNDDGSLNRAKMRALVFNHPDYLKKLEAITHPLIRLAAENAATAAAQKNPPYLIFMIPLLFESKHWQGKYQKIIVIDCPVEQQIRRVQDRNGLNRAEIEKIIEAQASRETRLKNADFVIDNAGSWEYLINQVTRTHEQILKSMSENLS